jgi:hypothetical protein
MEYLVTLNYDFWSYLDNLERYIFVPSCYLMQFEEYVTMTERSPEIQTCIILKDQYLRRKETLSTFTYESFGTRLRTFDTRFYGK